MFFSIWSSVGKYCPEIYNNYNKTFFCYNETFFGRKPYTILNSPIKIHTAKDGLVIEVAKDIIESYIEEKEALWNSELPFNVLLEQAMKNQNIFINRTNLEFLKTFIEQSDDVGKLADNIFNKRYNDLLEKFMEKGRREGKY